MRLLPTVLACLALSLTGQAASNGTWPWQSYRTTTVDPPSLEVTKSGKTAPGYLFFDQNGPKAHNYSLYIMSEENDLVWASQFGGYSAYKPQHLRGEPVLTFMNGISFSEPFGFGYGIIQILDNSYESIYNVSLTVDQGNFTAKGGFNESLLYSWIDMHEARITKHDTMLVTLYNVTQYDLSAIGGPKDGWVTDSLFYEIDIVTNEILFTWSALDHVDEIPLEDVVQFYPLEEYGRNQTLPYGYFHINSVDKFEDGSYLISSRFFCSVFRIGRDGHVEWTLQGDSGGDFKLGSDISFRYQHDARIRKESAHGLDISFFNNDNSDVTYGVNETEGLILHLDTEGMTASLTRILVDPKDTIYAASQGNLQFLPDGHDLMSYGSTPKMKEYSPNGTVLMTVQFGYGDGEIFTYRGYKSPWVGLPKAPPGIYSCLGEDDETMVYMSWNGATEHQHWNVFSGESEDQLKRVKTVKKDGFETAVSIKGSPSYVQVEACGDGITSKKSEVVAPKDKC